MMMQKFRNYPGIKTYDMETIAATPPGRIPEPLSAPNANISSVTQLQVNPQICYLFFSTNRS